ncbi:MAG: condensation domain-containing protein [Bacteroidota bacterium]
MLAYENIKDIYSLSPLQKGIYFHALYDHASLAYFEQMAYHFTGDLNIELIKSSLEELFNRHDILRTVFNHEKIDVPLQIVLKKVDLNFHFEDLRSLGKPEDIHAYVNAFKEKDKKSTFHLSKDVLVRVALFQTEDEAFEFIWTHHHIIIDGWCSEILIAEFFEIYSSYLENRPYQLPKVVPYRVYIQWLQKQDEKASHHYWKQYLANYSNPAFLPKAKTGSQEAYQRETHFFKLSREHTKALELLAKESQVTLNTIFQVIWGVLLSKYNNQRDVVFGMVVSGRPSEIEGVESMLGLFINTIPVRIQYDEHGRFDHLLKSVHQQAIESQSHAYTSLADIQEASALKRNLIDHLYGFQNYQKAKGTDLSASQQQIPSKGQIREVAYISSFEQTNYDFDIRVAPGEVIEVMLEYNAYVFQKEVISRLEYDIQTIIYQIVEDSTLLVDAIHLSSLDETQKALLAAYNSTQTNYPRNSSVVELFAEQVKALPAQPAIFYQSQSFTYQELDQKSNRMARFLLAQGLPKEGVVAIYQRQSFDLIASMLGVLKAGGAYLPLNIQHPTDQIKNLLHDSGASIVLSEPAFIGELNQWQWECPALKTFLCLGSDNVYKIREPESKLMSKELWEYVGSAATDHISGGGWVNCYTGDNFSAEEMAEYAENVYQKLLPYVNASTKVLEIGCASGISMFRLAPHVGQYYGTDLSQPIIDRNKRLCEEKGITNIRLACLAAEEIAQIDERNFDVVIINSVVQCFSGYNYLRQIISSLFDLLSPNGIIFLGDLMDLDSKETFVQSLKEYRKVHQNPKTKVDFSQELFVPRRFLDDLRHDFPQIEEVVHSNKVHSIKNELTDFRYDSILKVNKTTENGVSFKNKNQFDDTYLRQFSEEPVQVSIRSDQLSNIIYTSGSTGKPKGILIEHRGLVRLVKNTNYMQVSPGDVWGQTVDCAFDPSTLEIFGALLNGAALCLIPKETLLNARELAQTLSQHKVTILVLITPIFHELALIDPSVFAGLHTLIIGGEALHVKHVNLVRAKYPSLKIINAYGPTENTVISTTFLVDRTLEEMFIGKPIANSEVYILDPHDRVQPFGMMGELCVAGDGLARGYLNDEVLTNEKFIPHPFKSHERLYKTGDNARLLSHGNLVFLGRKDEQTKIRGYRIEPAEVEKVVGALPEVEEAVVLVVEMETDKALCAFVKLHQPTEEAVLRQAVAAQLPAYMVPARFVQVDKFPLSSTGKIDRKALQATFYLGQESNHANLIAPRTEQEEAIALIWREVLATTAIGVTDNFFEKGGHSLKAMQIVSRLSKKFEVQVDLKDFFAKPTIEGLAQLIHAKEYHHFQEITPVPHQEYYGVSHAQKRLWILNQYEENQTAYNISGAYHFHGLIREVFERTLEATVNRHECLRTTFITVEGEPKQKIHEAASLGIRVEYINLAGDAQAEEKAHRMAADEQYRPFDLATGPLVRMKLLQLTEESFIFIFTMHHIISDGWSMRLLMEEVALVYEALSQGLPNPIPPLRVQYKDFVHWQEKIIQEKEEQYWLQKLSGTLNLIQLPHDFPDTNYHTFRGGEEQLTLSKEVKEKLQDLAHEHGTSLSNVLFTIFNILLYNISGQEDLVVGVAIANRNHPDVEKMVGFFVNTLVLRTQISEESEFEEVLKQVATNMVEAFDHQNYPFDLLVEQLNPDRITNKQPIFNVLYGFQNFTDVSVGLASEAMPSSPPADNATPLSMEAISQGTHTAKFDLTLFVYTREDSLTLLFEYNSELFKPTAIQKWLQYFEKFVGVLVTENATVG